MAHTPGPWFSKNDGKEIHDREMFRDEHGALTGSRPNLIARIEIAPFDIWGNANGALIAAAPELLKALENLAKEFDPSGADEDALMFAAWTAIAKAKGGA
jgi:hypothetical protein